MFNKTTSRLKLFILQSVLFSLGLSFSSLAYELGAPRERKAAIINRVTLADVQPPLMVKNNLINYSTVQVLGQAASGSGVLIANKGQNYYVLTARHVINSTGNNEEIEIMTPDQAYHMAEIIKASKSLDVALLRFKSEKYYYPAFIDQNTFPEGGQEAYVVGYALPTNETKLGTLRKSPGEVLSIFEVTDDGYDFLYNNATNRGMSGGPVFARHRTGMLDGLGTWGPKNLTASDCKADYFFVPPLIGIHGRGESYATGGKSGANLGISIHTALAELASSLQQEGIMALPKEGQTRLYKDGCPLHLKAE